MSQHGVRQGDLVGPLGRSAPTGRRSEAYISARMSGQKPMDTDFIDAVGELTGLDTLALVAEVTRRMETAGDPGSRRSRREVIADEELAEAEPDTPPEQGRHESA